MTVIEREKTLAQSKNRTKLRKSAFPRFGVDHLPVLQERLPDALIPGTPMINVSRIIHDLFCRSPVSGSEWLIPGGKDVIVRDERARVLWSEIKTRKIDLQPVYLPQ